MTVSFSLAERVVVVTGAGGLLGRHHVGAVAAAGATVVAADIDRDAASAALGDISGETGHLAIRVDVTDPASVAEMVDKIMNRVGRIDALVNSAAINDMYERPELGVDQSSFERYPTDSWRKMFDVNVTGTFLVCQAVAPLMEAAGSGSIVNIGSTYGLVGPDQRLYQRSDGSPAFLKSPAYPTTKGAVIAFTRYLASYYGESGVRVNTLSPGGVENGQDAAFIAEYRRRVPLRRMAAADEYGGAIVFLCSDASAYMTGANLVVDGGWTAW